MNTTYKVQVPGFRTRTVRSERSALTAAARMVNANYDGHNHDDAVITGPEGSFIYRHVGNGGFRKVAA